MVRVYTLSNLVLVHFAQNFSLGSKCFEFQSSYCTKVGFPSLPSPPPRFPSLGKGLKREEASLFPLPIVPRGLFIFRCIAIFIGILRGSLCGVERKRPVSLCEYLWVFFFIFIGCLSPLGMKSRFIKDGQISASSSMSDLQLPSAGRLHNTA